MSLGPRGRAARRALVVGISLLACVAATLPAAPGAAGELSDLVKAKRAHRDAPNGGETAPPPSREEVARNWDAFLTAVVKRAGADAPRGPLREELLGVLIGERHRLVTLLTDATVDGPQMMSTLFESSWDQLTPVLDRIAADLPPETARRYRSFVEAGDLMRAAERLGVARDLAASPDSLRRLAELLVGKDAGDPLRFETGVDPELREIFGFGAPLAPPLRSPLLPDTAAPSPSGDQGRQPPDAAPAPDPGALARPRIPPVAERLLDWLFPAAWAASAPTDRHALAERLNSWIPERKDEVRQYVPLVHDLLRVTVDEATRRARDLDPTDAAVFQNLVITTAWQESCWRQFVRREGEVQPLVGPVGSVGLMQINWKVWRGIYDPNGLEQDIGYNGRAGTEILWHYMTDLAMRAGEDRVAGGADNLARAAYAAYNGGPRHLARYRNPDTSEPLKAIDREFYRKYRAVKAGDEEKMISCYPTEG